MYSFSKLWLYSFSRCGACNFACTFDHYKVHDMVQISIPQKEARHICDTIKMCSFNELRGRQLASVTCAVSEWRRSLSHLLLPRVHKVSKATLASPENLEELYVPRGAPSHPHTHCHVRCVNPLQLGTESLTPGLCRSSAPLTPGPSSNASLLEIRINSGMLWAEKDWCQITCANSTWQHGYWPCSFLNLAPSPETGFSWPLQLKQMHPGIAKW